MIGRTTSQKIFPTLLAALFFALVFTQTAFAQDPTGREAPPPARPARKETKTVKETRPVKKEQSKPLAKSAGEVKTGKEQSKPLAKSAGEAKTGKEQSKPLAKSAGEAKTGKAGRIGKSAIATSTASKAPPVSAKLTIVAPPGAAVEVDGKPRGIVGAEGALVLSGLVPGDHRLSVIADGYEAWRDTFVMSTASTRFEVPIKKKPPTGRLELISNEPGTEILIDEKYGVKTIPGQPTRVAGLLPGVRQLRAIEPGFKEWRGIATVKGDETVTVNVVSKPILDPEMLRVPEGSFTRGNDKGAKDQRPSHQVFTTAYEISRSEVSNRLYKFFIDATNRPSPRGVGYGWNGNEYPAGQGDLPVVFVSWEDAVAFCKWLSEQTGSRYRLPTEAEWEKAAKLGGDKYTSAGKIWEWCSDWHDPDYYKERERINPQGPARGKRYRMLGREGEAKVIRGGGFGLGMVTQRAAERSYFFPTITRFDIGFRIVREVSK